MAETSFVRLLEAMLRLAGPPPPKITPGGYPEEIFLDLTEDEKEKYECGICYQVLKEPHRCLNDHNFCGPCIKVWSGSGYTMNYFRCPVCRSEDGIYLHHDEMEAEINEKRVKCTLKSCFWKGKLCELQSHHHTNYGNIISNSDAHESQKITLPKLPGISQNPTSTITPSMTHTGLPNPRQMPNLANASNDGPIMVPRPPSMPRPTNRPTRRISSVNTANNATTSTPSLRSGQSVTAARSDVGNMRTRLRESREHINDMMALFVSELEDNQVDIIDMQQERERQRQQHLNEVHELGRRLGQVAADLRHLLQPAETTEENNNSIS